MAVFPGDYLTVQNNSDVPISFTWDGRTAKIPPHSQGMATFEQVVNHMGHPAAGTEPYKMVDDTGQFHIVPTRAIEIERIRLKQAWKLGIEDVLWETSEVPPIVILDQEGNRVWTVAEDPEGNHQMVKQDGPINQADQIRRLERMVESMKMQMVQGDARDLQVGPTDQLPQGPTGPIIGPPDVPTDE